VEWTATAGEEPASLRGIGPESSEKASTWIASSQQIGEIPALLYARQDEMAQENLSGGVST
jgi:hypothetical protein